MATRADRRAIIQRILRMEKPPSTRRQWKAVNSIILHHLPEEMHDLYSEAALYLATSTGKGELPERYNVVFEYIKEHMT
jgi:hypothetical protein